jgi:hypothetical protein
VQVDGIAVLLAQTIGHDEVDIGLAVFFTVLISSRRVE